MSKLQDIRLAKEMSQNDLAEKSGVSKRTIQCYEQGTRPIDGAGLNHLCSLSLALGCRIDDILEDEKLIKCYKKVR